MNTELKEVIQTMQTTYDQFESALQTYKKLNPASGMLERNLPMFGRYFATFSTCLETLDRNIPGAKPNSFKTVRIALGKVIGKNPLWKYAIGIGSDNAVRREGLQELLRYVPEVIYVANSMIESVPPMQTRIQTSYESKGIVNRLTSLVTARVSRSEMMKTMDEHAVVPEQKSDYPLTFKNLRESRGMLAQTIGETRQAGFLKTSFERVTRDLFDYAKSADEPSTFVPLPNEISELKTELSAVFQKHQAKETLDSTAIGMLEDYDNAVRGFVEQEETEWNRQIEEINRSRRNRERTPSQNF